MSDNPLANNGTAGLPVQARPAVSDIPTVAVIGTSDAVTASAYASLAREVSTIVGIVRVILDNQTVERETLRVLTDRTEHLASTVHTALERHQTVVAPPQSPKATVYDATAVETAYRAALAAHSVAILSDGYPDVQARKLSAGALYQLMACEPPGGNITTAQTAVQGNGEYAGKEFGDARRFWKLLVDHLRPGSPTTAAGDAKRELLEWLASPTERSVDGLVPRYMLVSRAGMTFAQVMLALADSEPDPTAKLTQQQARLALIQSVQPDPGPKITTYS